MNKNDFFYDLPQQSIAQTPLEKRDHSRLLCLDRTTGHIEHRHFYDLPSLLNPGDLLVLNDSRVLPARLLGQKREGGSIIEFLLLEQKEKDIWEILVRPGKKVRTGAVVSFGDGLLKGEILQVLPNGNRIARFEYDPGRSFYDVLDSVGEMPLPHYITEQLSDSERYQTVYSKEIGSAAAPTAGLHMTPELLSTLQNMGVNVAYVTLHVGLGTFRPVKANDITEHDMHSEHYYMPQNTADAIKSTKAAGGRVICLGTTSARTVETVGRSGNITQSEGYTNIFIYPGYDFSLMDGLITNFHLPESTLIMLVSAFAGRENTLTAYECAVKEGYRFYSFGDAMVVL